MLSQWPPGPSKEGLGAVCKCEVMPVSGANVAITVLVAHEESHNILHFGHAATTILSGLRCRLGCDAGRCRVSPLLPFTSLPSHCITDCFRRKTFFRSHIGVFFPRPRARYQFPERMESFLTAESVTLHRLPASPSFSSPSNHISCPSPSLTHLPANAPKTAIAAIPHQAAPTTPFSNPTP